MVRRWIAPLGVLLVMVFVVAGGYLVSGALSQPIGRPVAIGPVTVFPLSGWQAGPPGTNLDLIGIRFTRGNADLDVFAVPTDFDSEVLLARYVTGSLKTGAQDLSVSKNVEEVVFDSGLAGVRVSYIGTFGDRSLQVEGEVTAVVSPSGAGAIFDAWGPSGLFGYARGDAREMVGTARVG